MRTVSRVRVGDDAVAESAFEWNVDPDGKHLTMRIDADLVEGNHYLSWQDQFALLDSAWLALVEIRRAERRHKRRNSVPVTEPVIVASTAWQPFARTPRA